MVIQLTRKNAYLFCDDKNSDTAPLSVKFKSIFNSQVVLIMCYHKRSRNPESCLIHAGHSLLTSFLMRAKLFFFRISFKNFYVWPWPGSSVVGVLFPYTKVRTSWSASACLSVSLTLSLKSINNVLKFTFNPIWMQKVLAPKDVTGVERPGEWVTRSGSEIDFLWGELQTQTDYHSVSSQHVGPFLSSPLRSKFPVLCSHWQSVIITVCYNYVNLLYYN